MASDATFSDFSKEMQILIITRNLRIVQHWLKLLLKHSTGQKTNVFLASVSDPSTRRSLSFSPLF